MSLMKLLDSGNLVLKDGNETNSENFLWQSFDYPCDTLLPGMKLGKNFLTGLVRSLSSWKSPNDPSPSQFSVTIDPRGFPQFVVWKGQTMHYRLGSWNGLRFAGTPELRQVNIFKYEFELTKNEVYYKWESETLSSLFSRLVVNESGFLQRYVRTPASRQWTLLYAAPFDQCDYYALCGAYASCKSSPATCACLDGIKPKYPQDWRVSKWSGECVSKANFDCRNDVFQRLTGFKLPDTSNSQFNTSMSLRECGDACLRNCSCTAYANSDIRDGGSGCLLWFGDLVDMREYTETTQDLYIRKEPISGLGKKLLAVIVSSVILVAMVFIGIIFYVRSKKLRDQARGGEEEMELPTFSFTTIVKATDNFSNDNRLGEGGFGTVYKGTLAEGQEVAIKRLSKNSRQGMEEFKNEVVLIAKLQHRNLVKLLGCCIQGDEEMLIYEYMPNKSLDYFIFDEMKRATLDWPRRLHIIGGIARGLIYLHQDSRLRIIHRDLKASNVLLDKDLNPKISDFGMARMFRPDQTEANTTRVVGTYGYMSPEYAVDGLFSVKSDVYSFGVLVLEIISGKKNRRFSHPDHNHNLLGHAWRLWMEGRPLEAMDTTLGDSYKVSEVARCIHVALFCVQKRPEDRPSMSSVVLMLGSDNPLPQPKLPGFFIERNLPKEEGSSSQPESASVNGLTISMLDAR